MLLWVFVVGGAENGGGEEEEEGGGSGIECKRLMRSAFSFSSSEKRAAADSLAARRLARVDFTLWEGRGGEEG